MSAMRDLKSIESRLGQPLDVTIYAEGRPVALAGSLISDELVNQLLNLDPHLLTFEHHSGSSPGGTLPLSVDELKQHAGPLRERAGLQPMIPALAFAEACDKMHIVYDTARYIGRLEVATVAKVAEGLLHSVRPAGKAAFNVAPPTELESYDFVHAVNCCCLAMSVFRDFVDSEHDLLDAAIGLLLHDIGKTKIDDRLLKKKERLTAAEEQLIARHVLYGYNMVRNHPGIPTVAKDLILNHHERCNGTGYLRGLREAELSQWDLIAGVVDVFDAMTSSRSYRQPVDPHNAISQLVHDSGSLFSSRLVHYLVRCMGRFPVGTFVKLSSGEVALVTEANPAMQALPKVCVLIRANGMELETPWLLDLATDSQGTYIDFPVDLFTPSAPASAVRS